MLPFIATRAIRCAVCRVLCAVWCVPQTKGWERLVSDGQLAAAGVEVVAVRTVAEALLAGLGAGTADHRPPHVSGQAGRSGTLCVFMCEYV